MSSPGCQAVVSLTARIGIPSARNRMVFRTPRAIVPPSGSYEITGATPSPPGGRTVPLAAWFDQGSFSRWMLRQQPDTDQVLLDLLDHLTDHAAEQLLAALISL